MTRTSYMTVDTSRRMKMERNQEEMHENYPTFLMLTKIWIIKKKNDKKGEKRKKIDQIRLRPYFLHVLTQRV